MQVKFKRKTQNVEKHYIWIGMSFHWFFKLFFKTSENAVDQLYYRDNTLATRSLPFIKKIIMMEISF